MAFRSNVKKEQAGVEGIPFELFQGYDCIGIARFYATKTLTPGIHKCEHCAPLYTADDLGDVTIDYGTIADYMEKRRVLRNANTEAP